LEDEDQFNSEEPLLILEEGRDRFLKSFLAGFEIPAPPSLIKDIVALTDGYTINQFAGILIDIICLLREEKLDYSTCLTVLRKVINKFDPDGKKQEKLTYLDQIYQPEEPPQFRWVLKEYLGSTDDDCDARIVLDENGRNKLIKAFLVASQKSATQELIDNIIELTDGYTLDQFMEVLIVITNTTKKNKLNRYACLIKLVGVINKFEIGQTKEERISRLGRMVYRLEKPKPMPFDPDAFKRDLEFFDANDFLPENERFDIVKERIEKFQKAINDKVAENIYFERPIFEDRFIAVKEILSLARISAPESLIADIAGLTDEYSLDTITKVVKKMIKKSKTNSLDPINCIEILRESIDLWNGEEEIKEFKLEQLEEISLKYGLTKC
ncbi:MAG: hypothetical protein WCD44_00620, partial [Candidatus Babeliales bacterium]